MLVLINKTGPAAKLLSWQRRDRCHVGSFVMYSPDAKFEEHCFNISEVFLMNIKTERYKITFVNRLIFHNII